MHRLLYVLAGAVVGWLARDRYKDKVGLIFTKSPQVPQVPSGTGVVLVHPDLVAAAADIAVKHAGSWSATAKELAQRWASGGDSVLSMPEIQQFQSEVGLTQTSTLDDPTRAALAGCAQASGATVPVMVTGPVEGAIALAHPGAP